MRRAGAVSNDSSAQEFAEDLLRKDQSAVAAALGAFFMVAAESEGTLFGPLILLVAGVGGGVKVFDGRLRQPGLGTKRPRGFLASETIPMAARVGIPMSIAAAGVALAFDGRQRLGSVLRPAVIRARDAGFPARSNVLDTIASVGPKALSEAAISQAFLRIAAPSAGGLVTPADLRQVPTTDFGAQELTCPEGTWSYPFATQSGAPEPFEQRQRALDALGSVRIVLTADPQGSLACACFFRPTSGMAIEGLELSVPGLARPVQRGLTRVPAGTPLFAPAPVAVLQAPEGGYSRSVGLPDAETVSLETLLRARLKLHREPATLAVY